MLVIIKKWIELLFMKLLQYLIVIRAEITRNDYMRYNSSTFFNFVEISVCHIN